MARIESSYAKSLYFCNVKSNVRHEVAGKSSVFRARDLLVKILPDECASSNARKGTARDTLTARIGVLYCLNVMCKNGQEQQNVMLKTMKDVQDFFEDFKSVNELWKIAAKAGAQISYLQIKEQPEDLADVVKMLDYFEMMLEVLEPMSKKGGEV